MKATTDETIANDIASPGLTLVDVWAVWCTPCRMYSPVIDQFAANTGVPVFGLDADSNPQTMRDCNIMSIPTTLVYYDGNLVRKLVGAMPFAKLSKEVEGYM